MAATCACRRGAGGRWRSGAARSPASPPGGRIQSRLLRCGGSGRSGSGAKREGRWGQGSTTSSATRRSWTIRRRNAAPSAPFSRCPMTSDCAAGVPRCRVKTSPASRPRPEGFSTSSAIRAALRAPNRRPPSALRAYVVRSAMTSRGDRVDGCRLGEEVAHVELRWPERRVVEVDHPDPLADQNLLLVEVPVYDRRERPRRRERRGGRAYGGGDRGRGPLCPPVEDLQLALHGVSPERG